MPETTGLNIELIFQYFFALGFGVAMGIAIVAIPAKLLYKYINNRWFENVKKR